MAKQERNYGIDFLRIICMLAMIIQHLLGHGWVMQQLNPQAWKYSLGSGLEAFSLFGISCFALISGYVGIQTRYRYTTLALQWMKVFLYSVSITLVLSFVTGNGLSANAITTALFPTFKNQYWYFSSYAGCFLLAPLLNMALRQMNKKQATVLVAGLVAAFSIASTLSRTDALYVSHGKNTLWLIILYVIGGYLYQFDVMKSMSTAKLALLTLCSAVLAVGNSGWIRKLCILLTGKAAGYNLFRYNNSPTTLLLAVMMLLLFSRLKITRGKKLIAIFAPLNFSVYLIHDHPHFRQAFISKYSYILAEAPTFAFVPAVILAAVLVYLFCAAIDAIRERVFRRLGVKQKLLALEEKRIGFIWD